MMTTTTEVESAAARAVSKRYEGLVTVRSKAVKGKGAWYWAHLEPILVRNPSTDLPNAVKLRCSLCHSVFSASNPSRTATEHLKRATCPNISNAVAAAATLPPPPPSPSPSPLKLRKRKSPDSEPRLSKHQVDSALDLLARWFYDSCGSVSLSTLDSPKFKAFLARVGITSFSSSELCGPRLDASFVQATADSDARIEEAPFLQLIVNKCRDDDDDVRDREGLLVRFTVNLPNRSSVFRKAVVVPAAGDAAEEILWSVVEEICSFGGDERRCVGIISDKFKGKALKNLEARCQWMVNLPCQLRGIGSLIKDFARDLPLFRVVAENCSKIAGFVNSESQVRRVFHRHKGSDSCLGVLKAPDLGSLGFLAALEDFLGSSCALQMVAMDESCKTVFSESSVACEAARLVHSESFWNELEAVYSLTKIVRAAAQEVETERPLIGQCLPLWEELKRKIKDWSLKCSVADSAIVDKIVNRRFGKIYHPAMAAAFILDPLNLVRDNSGKYLPPFKCLTNEQEKDVDKLITRLVGREEAHIALMELMKWRSEGLDPLYAQAVQVKQRDPITGKMKIANPQSSRLVWETCLSEFKTLGKVAIRLVFLQATSCGFKCNWSFMKWVCVHRRSRVGFERAQKMLFVGAHAKLERRDLCSEEERDAELFAADHDDVLNDMFSDAHSVEDLLELVGG